MADARLSQKITRSRPGSRRRRIIAASSPHQGVPEWRSWLMPILPLPNSRSARPGRPEPGHQRRRRAVGRRGASLLLFRFRGAAGRGGASAADAGEGGAHAVLCAAQYPGGGAAGGRSGRDVHARGPALRVVQRVLRRVCAPGRGRGGAGRHARGAGRDQCGCESAAAPGAGGAAGVGAAAPERGQRCLARVDRSGRDCRGKGAAAHALAQGFCRDADAVGGHGVPPCADGAALRQFVQRCRGHRRPRP